MLLHQMVSSPKLLKNIFSRLLLAVSSRGDGFGFICPGLELRVSEISASMEVKSLWRSQH